MVNKQAKTKRNAKGVLIEQLKAQKHSQPDKGCTTNLHKRTETLKECLQTTSLRMVNKQAKVGETLTDSSLNNLLRRNILNQSKDGQAKAREMLKVCLVSQNAEKRERSDY